MTNFTSKLTAIVGTLLLSTACITAAVGPAPDDFGAGAANAVVSAARVA